MPLSSGPMSLARRVLVVLLVVIIALVAVVGLSHVNLRTAHRRGDRDGHTRTGVHVDSALAAKHLAEAVRFRTVSHQDAQENDTAEWDRLHAWLQATYPAAHAAMTREVVAGHTLVYTWRGVDPSLPPIVLLAHHDVVPVTPGTEHDWTHPPFEGVIADGAVWGRGPSTTRDRWSDCSKALESLVTRDSRRVVRLRRQRARRRGRRVRRASRCPAC